jgi:hypothetical protein
MSDNKQSWFKASEPSGPCPPADELWSFGRGALAADRRDALKEHLSECVWCSEKIARMTEPSGVPDSEAAAVPDDLDRRLRKHWTVSPFVRIWRSQILWMVLFVGSVLVSFADPRHYKQWLVIALVTGVRWALSERAARHTIWSVRVPEASGTASGGRIGPGTKAQTKTGDNSRRF